MSPLLGRTNEAFSPIWLSLAAPQEASTSGWLDQLVAAAVEAGTVLDVSKGPALWGGALRGSNARLMTLGGTDVEYAVDTDHATNLVQAHLLQTLSAIGRETIDLYFLQVRRKLEDFQFQGALQALELAKQDGHIGHVGLCCDGPPLAVLAQWQLADSFEVLLVPRNHFDDVAYKTLVPLARERRVGIVTSKPLNWGFGLPFMRIPIDPQEWPDRLLLTDDRLAQAAMKDLSAENPILVVARTPEQIRVAVAASGSQDLADFDSILLAYKDAWRSDEAWRALHTDPDPIVRKAIERRNREIGE